MISINPNAIDLLKTHRYYIDRWCLSINPNITKLLEDNTIEHINITSFNNLFKNPSIFEYDYELIKKTKQEINEEVYMKSLNPKRMLKLMEK